jgi:hypothetical protein
MTRHKLANERTLYQTDEVPGVPRDLDTTVSFAAV